MKKIIVPYNPSDPKRITKGFLIPKFGSFESIFEDIQTRREFESGLVVYVGREIGKHDLFKKIVDSKRQIDSVDDMLNRLDNYLTQISLLKIGAVVKINAQDGCFILKEIEK